MADVPKPDGKEPPPEKLAELISGSLSKISEIASSKHSSEPTSQTKPAAARLVREIGPQLKAPLKRPLSLAWTTDDALLVLDRPDAAAFRVQRFDAAGKPVGDARTIPKGSGDAELMDPVSLAVDGEQQVYIVDAQDACVKKFSAEGQWLDTFRSAGPTGKLFDNPLDVAVDETGNLLIADANNNRIVQLQPDGELSWILETFPIQAGSAEMDEFFEPCSLCVGRGRILRVADRNQNRVLGFDAQRKVIGLWDEVPFPSHVRMAGDGTSVLVSARNRIVRYAASGAATAVIEFPFELGKDAKADGGGAIAIDRQGNLLVIDPVRESILVLAFGEK